MKLYQKSLHSIRSFVLFIIILMCLTTTAEAIKSTKSVFRYSISAEANSWVVNNLEANGKIIRKGGIKNWKDSSLKIRTYFKNVKPGKLTVGIIASAPQSESKIKISTGNKSKRIKVENKNKDTISVGTFTLKDVGYQWIEFEGISKTGEFFPEIEAILIGGEVTEEKVYFIREDFYWGRRGPSVHLRYEIPEKSDNIEWFYSEITVPEGNDVLGSYFMANGFGQGYFGFQVNSQTERRVLFSVWSPFETNNPKEIPENQRIKLLKKGEGVNTGEFGNEGSGGQSFLRFPWKAGNTYGFLLKGKPTGNGETDFTAWFFAPETNQWKLIASFRRPQTNTYLTNLYSFLENFMTETGYQTRMANYSNQWIITDKKEWKEISNISFSADATARKESRLDYAGGSNGDSFYLKNCGFINETTPFGSKFSRSQNKIHPIIDFGKLD